MSTIIFLLSNTLSQSIVDLKQPPLFFKLIELNKIPLVVFYNSSITNKFFYLSLKQANDKVSLNSAMKFWISFTACKLINQFGSYGNVSLKYFIFRIVLGSYIKRCDKVVLGRLWCSELHTPIRISLCHLYIYLQETFFMSEVTSSWYLQKWFIKENISCKSFDPHYKNYYGKGDFILVVWFAFLIIDLCCK